MMQRSPIYLLAGLVSTLILASGCGRGGSGGASSGGRAGTLMQAVMADPKTFNMLIARETSSTGAVGNMFSGLVRRDLETLEIQPDLAESYEHSNGGRTWTFKLRPDLKWSDGQPFTADDVIFTLDLIYDPKVDTTTRELLLIDKKPWKYTRVDDQTVRIDLPTPFGPFLDTAGFSILPKHKLHDAWKAGKFNSTWGVDTPPTELVGTGPLLLQKYTPGQSLLYKRNPHYWEQASDGQQLPRLDSAITQIVPDLNTVILKFRSKESHLVGLRPEDWPDFKKGEATSDYRALNLGPTWASNFIAFNQNPRAKKLLPYKREWFSKKEFRQAVSYAINRQSMVETVFRGLGRPQWSPVSEANKTFYNPKVKQYPHDPARAKELLAGLGYSDRNGDGILEDKGGHPIEFNLLTNTGNDIRTKLATIIQDDLKAVGIRAHFTPVEFNSLVTRVDNTYDWEAILLGFTGGPEPHTGKSIWTTPGQLHVWNPRQTSPATPWEAEIDRIFSEAAKTIDPSKRKALYDRWQEIVAEELPLIHLVTNDSLSAIRNQVKNIRPTALGLAWNIEEIYVE